MMKQQPKCGWSLRSTRDKMMLTLMIAICVGSKTTCAIMAKTPVTSSSPWMYDLTHRRLWGVMTTIRGGDGSTSAPTKEEEEEEEVKDQEEEEEEVSLDDRVLAAMNKLGISPPEDEENDDCADGVCAMPTANDEGLEKEEAVVESNEEIEKKLMKEFEGELEDSIIFAAMSATRNVETNRWNVEAARAVLQQELSAIERISADSEEVQTLVQEGYSNVSLVRRALAFSDGNVDDARAILEAEEADYQQEKEEEEKQKAKEQKQQQAAAAPQPAIAVNVPTNFDPAATATPPPVVKKEVIPVVYDVSASTFQEIVIESPVPVLLDVYADWCGPCKALTPALEDIAEKAKGAFRLCKLNTDEERTISSNALQVKALPTVFAIRNGKIIDSFQGMPRDEQTLRQFLMRLIAPSTASGTGNNISSEQMEKYQEYTVSLYKIASMASMPFAKRERLEMYIQEKVCNIWLKNDPSNVREGLELIKKLCQNIISHPTDEKYKTWNLENPVFKKKGLSVENKIFTQQLLPILGFTKPNAESKVFYNSKNISPLIVCQSSLDKWITVHRRQMATEERKKADELARAKLEFVEEEYDEYDEEEVEDDGTVLIRLRVQGKKKVHEINASLEETTLAQLVKPYLKNKNGGDDEEYQIVCPSKRVTIASTDENAMAQKLQKCDFIGPSTSLVLQFASSAGKEDKEANKLKLQERAAARRSKTGGYHTMQSVGIYSKDDNAKGELIDGGGGVWYEQDVTSDDEGEQNNPLNEDDGKDEKSNSEEESGEDQNDQETSKE